MIRKKNNPHKLTISQADATLQKVFSAVNTEPNTIPIKNFIAQQKVNTFFFKTCLTICLTFIILTMLMPIPFLSAHRKVHDEMPIFETIRVTDDYVENDTIYLTMSTDLDWERCYLVLPDKTTQAPVSYDPDSRKIAFPYEDTDASIYILTQRGSSATIVITRK